MIVRGILVLAASLALVATGQARPVRYTLPVEQPAALPPGADAELVEGQCAACHSLDYVTTQPRGKGAQFWRDAVTKMVKVYGAPIEADDARRIEAYLATTFG